MLVTDGGVNIPSNNPILIGAVGPTVGGVVTWIINPTYYPPKITYTELNATFSTLIPGQYVQGATASVGYDDSGQHHRLWHGRRRRWDLPSIECGIERNWLSSGSPVALITTGIGEQELSRQAPPSPSEIWGPAWPSQ